MKACETGKNLKKEKIKSIIKKDIASSGVGQVYVLARSFKSGMQICSFFSLSSVLTSSTIRSRATRDNISGFVASAFRISLGGGEAIDRGIAI